MYMVYSIIRDYHYSIVVAIYSSFLKSLSNKLGAVLAAYIRYHMYIYYSLRPIILFTNIDISRYILVVDTSVLVKSNMGWREYNIHAQIKTTGKMSESVV
jgi:hypothetical protein